MKEKKQSEIKGLLLIMHPTIYKSDVTWKAVTTRNCYFLLKLAHEYHMGDTVKKCENVLITSVSAMPGNTFPADLTFAQNYKLDKLLRTAVERACRLRLCDLKSHEVYDRLDRHIYKHDYGGNYRKVPKRESRRQLKEVLCYVPTLTI